MMRFIVGTHSFAHKALNRRRNSPIPQAQLPFPGLFILAAQRLFNISPGRSLLASAPFASAPPPPTPGHCPAGRGLNPVNSRLGGWPSFSARHAPATESMPMALAHEPRDLVRDITIDRLPVPRGRQHPARRLILRRRPVERDRQEWGLPSETCRLSVTSRRRCRHRRRFHHRHHHGCRLQARCSPVAA